MVTRIENMNVNGTEILQLPGDVPRLPKKTGI